MSKYKADNGKYIDTRKLTPLYDASYEGCYGDVDVTVYRTPVSHEWYAVSESSWSGVASISGACYLTPSEVVEMIGDQLDDDDIEQYPELRQPYEATLAK